VSRHRLDRIEQVAHDGRVTEIETDADVGQIQFLFDHLDERIGRRQIVRNHFERQADAERLRDCVKAFDAAPGLLAVVVVRPRTLRGREAEMHDQVLVRNDSRDFDRRDRFLHAVLPCRLVAVGDRIRRAPSCADEAFDNGSVHRVEAEAGRLEPPAELRDRSRVAVLEMPVRGKQFDAIEAVLRDFPQMLLGERVVVEEVGRYAELHLRALRVENCKPAIVTRHPGRWGAPPTHPASYQRNSSR
jgi:hypothetical protein